MTTANDFAIAGMYSRVVIPLRSLSSFALLTCLVMSVLVLGGCGDPTYAWRQKMTIEMETPDGIKTASSVISVDVEVGTGFLAKATSGSPVSWKIRGEAVTVSLGQGRYFFALLKGRAYQSEPGRNALFAFADMASYDPASEPLPAHQIERAKLDQPATLNRDSYPYFVTFTDINDPASVTLVDPSSFAMVFGDGHALRRVTLEITDEQATFGKVEAALSWWSNLKTPIGGNAKRPYGDPLYSIGKWDFVR
jgi:hypothetical protein